MTEIQPNKIHLININLESFKKNVSPDLEELEVSL